MLQTNILLVAVIGCGLLLTWRQTRSNRKVAAQILASNAEVAAKADAANERNTIALAAIHTLVNSNLTAARSDQLAATRVSLASLQELADFKRAQGIAVSADAADAIQLAETRVAELARDLAHKQEQTDIADAQTKRQQ